MHAAPTPGRLRRLIEELGEVGLDLAGSEPWHDLAVDELEYALRPKRHERRVPSAGAFIDPTIGPEAWEEPTGLRIERRPVGELGLAQARAYADGIACWLIRRTDHHDEWVVFDRPAGSERDLVILAEALGAVLVQRHPSGVVRIVGPFGVYRFVDLRWHHEPLVSSWIDAVEVCAMHGDRDVLETMLEFAVHDLGARGIGATLVYRPDQRLDALLEPRLALPPPLQITRPADLAPLRHVLGQVDGATLFDETGTLMQIGVRLVSTPEAETGVEGFRGMRHTAARRYSFDDPLATVIVISEDGPVTVLRRGEILGRSAPAPNGDDPTVDEPPAGV